MAPGSGPDLTRDRHEADVAGHDGSTLAESRQFSTDALLRQHFAYRGGTANRDRPYEAYLGSGVGAAWDWCSRAAISSFSILACSAGSIAA